MDDVVVCITAPGVQLCHSLQAAEQVSRRVCAAAALEVNVGPAKQRPSQLEEALGRRRRAATR
eukprot:8721473-Lingulodinium_polyedra.AAC.1